MALDVVEQILHEAHDALPAETAKKVAIPSPKALHTKVERYKVGNYPMARGIRQAKIEIVKILSDSDNLTALREKLQDHFDEDPIQFLKTFEPMLRVYEQIERNKKEEAAPRGAIKIIVEEGAALKVEDHRSVILDGQATSRMEEADDAGGNEDG